MEHLKIDYDNIEATDVRGQLRAMCEKPTRLLKQIFDVIEDEASYGSCCTIFDAKDLSSVGRDYVMNELLKAKLTVSYTLPVGTPANTSYSDVTFVIKW